MTHQIPSDCLQFDLSSPSCQIVPLAGDDETGAFAGAAVVRDPTGPTQTHADPFSPRLFPYLLIVMSPGQFISYRSAMKCSVRHLVSFSVSLQIRASCCGNTKWLVRSLHIRNPHFPRRRQPIRPPIRRASWTDVAISHGYFRSKSVDDERSDKTM